MKILDWYIAKNYKLTFVFVIILLSIISIVVDFTEKTDAFTINKAPTGEIANYYIAFVPYITAFIFPLIVFISVIFFTTRLAYRSEVIAILSSGVSFNRFLRPFIAVSILLAGIIFYANHILIPIANKMRLKFENKYVVSRNISVDNDIHLRISKTEFIYLKNFNYLAKQGDNFCYEKIANQQLTEKIWAETITYDSIKKNWILKKLTIRKNLPASESLTTLDSMRVAYNFTPKDLGEENDQKSTMTTKELSAFIKRETLRGNPSLVAYKFEKERRSAAPFSVLILNIIGVCLASKKVRGGSGLQIAIGLAVSGTFVVFMQFSTAFAVKGGLNPLLAAWIPNIIFSAVAFYIYKKMQ